ncbi:MAG: 4Fe-4S dicluster domain-containing protein [Dysgonamonadaceae bacterium]|jgi:ferredoxin|nr:4Fe-4S dicluster domain-containing protein [Dysgonamonadaceae bacterium]
MLRRLRIITAALFFVLITLLFFDFTGVLHKWLGWLAKIQLIPVVLSVNGVVLFILILITLLFGRVYCSVICPLGIMQDGISNLSGRRKGKKNRFRHSKAKCGLRYSFLVLFIAAIIAGISAAVSLLDPYATYGRIVSSLPAPLYRLGNNLLAWFAEKADSYAFYSTEVWIKNWVILGISGITLLAVGFFAWLNGRTYCNTICPVGTALGFLSRFSIIRITFDADKCTKCGRCERNCKASCLDSKKMIVDHSRCVTCFNCIGKCNFNAIKYTSVRIKKQKSGVAADHPSPKERSRRSLLAVTGALALAQLSKAQQLLQVDGGLAEMEDRKAPDRKMPVVPPGALGLKNMQTHCTACQLCISVCPNNILRPSVKLSTFMQPEMSYDRGYCRPECTECSKVCPAGAIKPITTAGKTGISIGHAVWIRDNCVVNTDEIQCSNCERHCPTKAITLIALEPDNEKTLKTPVVDKELCIGCGACEYLCPARPFSAIYVEGNVRHHLV